MQINHLNLKLAWIVVSPTALNIFDLFSSFNYLSPKIEIIIFFSVQFIRQVYLSFLSISSRTSYLTLWSGTSDGILKIPHLQYQVYTT